MTVWRVAIEVFTSAGGYCQQRSSCQQGRWAMELFISAGDADNRRLHTSDGVLNSGPQRMLSIEAFMSAGGTVSGGLHVSRGGGGCW